MTYIVVSAEQHQQRAHGGGHQQQTILGKHVLVHATCAVVATDFHLCFERVAVQGREVKVGRSIIDEVCAGGGSVVVFA